DCLKLFKAGKISREALDKFTAAVASEVPASNAVAPETNNKQVENTTETKEISTTDDAQVEDSGVSLTEAINQGVTGFNRRKKEE
ncbi:MAG: hypothetical protein ABH884_02980, partial [Candidatus Komeilibacteria bacterium]